MIITSMHYSEVTYRKWLGGHTVFAGISTPNHTLHYFQALGFELFSKEMLDQQLS